MNRNNESKMRLTLYCGFIGLGLMFSQPIIAAPNVYVTDGDTIHVGGTTYRLEGIDAPETKQNCKDKLGREFRCGLQATRLLRQLLGKGSVRCVSSSSDRYGRLLGHCVAGRVDINGAMVEQGYARAFVKYSSEYVADETVAMAAHRGLWSGQWQAPWDWRAEQLTANDPIVGQCVIKGNIGKKGKVYYLPFHAAYSRVKIDANKGERWFCSEDEAMAQGWGRAD
jgi:endonuclease YncB( thermonuclease family)